jgi:putative transposase
MWKILEVLRRVARGERPRALGLDMRSEIGEGHPRPGRVHMAISIPEKYAAVQVGGVHQGEEGDSHCSGVWGGAPEPRAHHLWARRYFISTSARDGEEIRRYIQRHGEEDRRQDQSRFD